MKYRRRIKNKIQRLKAEKRDLKKRLRDVDLKLWWLRIDLLLFSVLFFISAIAITITGWMGYIDSYQGYSMIMAGLGIFFLILDYLRSR